MAYMLLSSQIPFNGSSVREVASRVVSGRYAFAGRRWAGVSRTARDLISRLLAADPADRPDADEALRHPWLAGRGERTGAAGAGVGTAARRALGGVPSGGRSDRGVASVTAGRSRRAAFRRRHSSDAVGGASRVRGRDGSAAPLSAISMPLDSQSELFDDDPFPRMKPRLFVPILN